MKYMFAILMLSARIISAQSIEQLRKEVNDTSRSTIERVTSLNLLSRELVYINDVEALQHANEALRLASQIGYTPGVGYAYRNLAGIYSYHESFFIGMEYLQRALDIFTANNDSLGLANCYVSLGHTYRRLHKRDEELLYHKKSLDFFIRLRMPERIGVSTHNLGETYYNLGKLELARQYTHRAITLNDSLGSKAVLSACYKVLGLISLSQNKLEPAKIDFERALDLNRSLGDNSQKIVVIESLLRLADIAQIQNNRQAQLNYLFEATEFCKAHGLASYLSTTYNELILVFSKENNSKKVQEYIRSYRAIADSLHQAELDDRANLTNGVVQIHELVKSTNELREINTDQRQSIANRNSTLIVVIVFLGVLILLLILLFRNNKKLNEQNRIIEIQRRDLEQLNATKNKFFSIVAHDLKSPLSSLKAFSVLLINHYDFMTKDEIILMSNRLKESVDNTIKMADNLIAWASIQMREIRFTEERIKLKEVVSNVCEVYKSVAQKKEIQMSCSFDDALELTGDKNQIEFIIRNLINNAIKFTKVGGAVTLEAHQLANGLVQISIADNGVGMTDEIKSSLFSTGIKHRSMGTAGETGTGLGLMLSHEFVKLNSGSIEIESTRGRGTTFKLFLRGTANG